MSDRVIVMDEGKLVASGTPKEAGRRLRELQHDMFHAMPTPMRVYARIDNELDCPVSVREGREFLHRLAATRSYTKELAPEHTTNAHKPSIELDEVWFKYERDGHDIYKGLRLKAYPGEIHAIVGGNGTGKTTAVSLIQATLEMFVVACLRGIPIRSYSRLCHRHLLAAANEADAGETRPDQREVWFDGVGGQRPLLLLTICERRSRIWGGLSMRHELIHFLSHVENEATMIEVIASLNADAFESLLHHLDYTSPDTQERWRELLSKLFRIGHAACYRKEHYHP